MGCQAKRAKGKSDEARRLNQELDNIKAQITRHYQYVCDHDSLVTAKSVYNRYLGFGDDYHTLMGLFREQLASYKEKIGKEKAASTYRGWWPTTRICCFSSKRRGASRI